MKTIVPEQGIIHAFTPDTPAVAHVELGEIFQIKTIDALNGEVTRPNGFTSEINMTSTNPATGPIHINGIEAGDMVGIEILAIDVDPEGIGLSLDRYRKISIKDGCAVFNDSLFLPINPHIGVIGLAPAEGVHKCQIPGEHGGNLDTKEVCPGSMILIPASVKGGGLAAGDVHAVMADGETNGAGLEVGSTVTLRVTKIKDPSLEKIHILTDDKLIVLASAPSLEEASRLAMSRTSEVLMNHMHIDKYDAALLSGYCCDLRISQIVNPLKTVKILIPRKFLTVTDSSNSIKKE